MDFDAEDKTCRICGFVDTSNINIFDSKWNNLLYKILTVFPLIVYESDPLPKNICRKCVTNVSLMFDETTKLFKVQKKWIDNVRVNQPNHPFFKILDLIEKSNNKLIMEARGIEPNFPYRGPRFYPNWLFSSTLKDTAAANPSTSSSGPLFKGKLTNDDTPPFKRDLPKKPPEASSPTLNIFKSKDITIGPRKLPKPSEAQSGPKPKPDQDQFKELKHKLQSNGCTLMSLVSGNKPVPRQPLMTPTNIGERCKYCAAVFFNIHYLAKHQLEHLTITEKRIFDKRYLDKKTRRGRLIPKGDKKCIRCLNCWKLFADNRGILDHWSTGECDFYCQICGKEFPNNPKMLREHVPAAHGISYRSSKRRTPDSAESPASTDGGSQKDFSGYSSNSELAEEAKKVKSEPVKDAVNADYLSESPPAYKPKAKKQKISRNNKVKCSICNLEFSNFRSKNSHMRKHKKKELPVQESEPETEKETEISIKQEKVDQLTVEENDVSEKNQSDDNDKKEANSTQADSGEKPRLVVKKLSDLQDPSVTSQHSDESQKKKPSTPVVSQPEEKPDEKASIKNVEDHMEHGKIYNCHPCGKQFSSKTELFEHKRQCQSNNKFACGFCLRAFLTSADLQMHIMLMH